MVARLLLLVVMSRKRLMWKRWWKPWGINCTLSYIPSTSYHIPFVLFFCRLLINGEPLMSWLTMQVYENLGSHCFLLSTLLTWLHNFRNYSGYLVDTNEAIPMAGSDWFESHWSISLYPGMCSCNHAEILILRISGTETHLLSVGSNKDHDEEEKGNTYFAFYNFSE